MRIDFATLFVTTGFITEVAGLLLLFSWLQERRAATLAYWGSAYAMGAIGGLLFCAKGFLPHFIGFDLGGALVLAAYGLMWCGARTFEGRSPDLGAALFGAALWLAAGRLGLLETYPYARVVLASMAMGTYAILTASEYWRAQDNELMSRWPAVVLLLIHGGLYFLRAAFADVVPFPGSPIGTDPDWIPFGTFAVLLNNFCLAFLVMNMTKERLEREQHRAAQIDALTGVANRRAFFNHGERLLERASADRGPAALLLFDLDLFKEINDTFGHQAGDRVLCDFCDIAASALRPNDVLGRLGGEEFACLLPGATAAQALQAADRIRTRFAALSVPDDPVGINATVSVGVAVASDCGYALPSLLAHADRGLYQAKAKGRNRVERLRAPMPELAGGTDVATAVA